MVCAIPGEVEEGERRHHIMANQTGTKDDEHGGDHQSYRTCKAPNRRRHDNL